MARGGDIHISTTELRELEFDLSRAPERVRNPEGLRKAAKDIEREMKLDWAGHRGSHFTPLKRFKSPQRFPISSELVSDTRAEIGVEAHGVGNLAPILAYGAPGHPRIGNSPATPGSAPVVDPGAAPRRAMEAVLNDLADHAEASVFGHRGVA